jgi:hypothetical protein
MKTAQIHCLRTASFFTKKNTPQSSDQEVSHDKKTMFFTYSSSILVEHYIIKAGLLAQVSAFTSAFPIS